MPSPYEETFPSDALYPRDGISDDQDLVGDTARSLSGELAREREDRAQLAAVLVFMSLAVAGLGLAFFGRSQFWLGLAAVAVGAAGLAYAGPRLAASRR